MKGKEIIQLLSDGASGIINFNKLCDTSSLGPDKGMKGEIISWFEVDEGVYVLECDLTDYENHNKEFDTMRWTDLNDNKCLWNESKDYPKNKIYPIFVEENEEVIFDLFN